MKRELRRRLKSKPVPSATASTPQPTVAAAAAASTRVISVAANSAWEDPIPLQAPRLLLRPFDVERMLPEVLWKPVVEGARRVGAPIEFAAASQTVAHSAITQRAARIQVMRMNNRWQMPLTLSGMLIGPPVSKKSVMARDVMEFIPDQEEIWRKEYVAARVRYEEESRAAQDSMRLHSAQVGQAIRAHVRRGDIRQITRDDLNEEIPALPQQGPMAPLRKRLLVGDISAAKLQDLGAEPQNGRGLFSYHDELFRFLASSEYAAMRAYFLGADSGQLVDPCDRMGREGRHASDGQSMVVFGGIVPEKFYQYMANEDGEMLNDGMMRRFPISVISDPVDSDDFVDEYVPSYPCLEGARERIFKLNHREPLIYQFDEESYEFYVDWHRTTLRSLARNPDFPPALQSHFANYEKVMAVLPTLFCLLDRPPDDPPRVSLAYMQQAAACCEWLASQAQFIYTPSPAKEITIAGLILEKINEGKLGANRYVTGPEIYSPHWGGLKKPKEVYAALKILEETGWIRAASARKRVPGQRGRTRVALYEISPRAYSRCGESHAAGRKTIGR